MILNSAQDKGHRRGKYSPENTEVYRKTMKLLREMFLEVAEVYGANEV